MEKTGIINSKDAQAVNFREIHMGNIAPNILYRSSHPIKYLKQEKIISKLAENAKVAAVLNLHDTKSGIVSKVFIAPWYNNLFKNNNVISLGMDFCVTGKNFQKKLKSALQFIINTSGPWLIHCHAGVDRTGFVCMVLESFMGAVLDEVINDYLLSFNSIFDSSIHEAAQIIDSFTALKILSVMSDSKTIDEKNLQQIAETYLRFTIGLSAEELELLRNKLSGNIK